MTTHYRALELDHDHGSCSGYHCSPFVVNYQHFILGATHDEAFSQILIQFIKEQIFDEVTVIKNLHVDDGFRGQGVGGSLLDEALSHSEMALLVADGFEEQLPGFSLLKFYEDRGFVTIKTLNVGYLMMYPAELAEVFLSEL